MLILILIVAKPNSIWEYEFGLIETHSQPTNLIREGASKFSIGSSTTVIGFFCQKICD